MKHTRKLGAGLPLLACACVAGGLLPANADLLLSESFNTGPGGYTLGDINGQTPATAGFSGPWAKQDAGHDVQIVGSGLSYSGLLTSGGALATGPVGRAGRNLAAPLDATASGTYYLSFLANYGVGGTHHRVFEAWNGPFTPAFGGDGTRSLMVGYSTFTGLGTTLSLSVNNGGDGANESDFDNNVQLETDGLTHLVVLRFDLSDSPGADTIFGYLDPADLSVEPDSANALLTGFDFELHSLGSLVSFVFDGTPTTTIDELRLGTTWADVLPVPEPSTIALLVLGGAGLLARRHKKA